MDSNLVVIFANQTRGGKYSIQLEMTTEFDRFPNSFSIREFTHGSETGYANLGNVLAEEAVNEYNRRIDAYAQYDGIFFTHATVQRPVNKIKSAYEVL
jgi:hypothetical protein